MLIEIICHLDYRCGQDDLQFCELLESVALCLNSEYSVNLKFNATAKNLFLGHCNALCQLSQLEISAGYS